MVFLNSVILQECDFDRFLTIGTTVYIMCTNIFFFQMQQCPYFKHSLQQNHSKFG